MAADQRAERDHKLTHTFVVSLRALELWVWCVAWRDGVEQYSFPWSGPYGDRELAEIAAGMFNHQEAQ